MARKSAENYCYKPKVYWEFPQSFENGKRKILDSSKKNRRKERDFVCE